MRLPPNEKDTEPHLAKIQVNYELRWKATPLSLPLSVFLYRFTWVYSTWYMSSFGISSLSSVKAPQWVLSGSGSVLPFTWSVCSLFYRRVPKLGPALFLPQRTNSKNSLSFFAIILSFLSTIFIPRISIGIMDTLAGSFFLWCLKKDLELVLIPVSSCSSNFFFTLPNYF